MKNFRPGRRNRKKEKLLSYYVATELLITEEPDN